MKIALGLLLTAQHARAACDGGGEWVDADTPPEACTSTSEFDQVELSLVFSDEFSTDGRTFADGGDPRWTALQLAPSTNEQVCWYNESLGVTRDGLLELISTSDDVDALCEETRELRTSTRGRGARAEWSDPTVGGRATRATRPGPVAFLGP